MMFRSLLQGELACGFHHRCNKTKSTRESLRTNLVFSLLEASDLRSFIYIQKVHISRSMNGNLMMAFGVRLTSKIGLEK